MTGKRAAKPAETSHDRDLATTRFVAFGLIVALWAFTAIVAMDVFFAHVRHPNGPGPSRLPTEVWMVISALVGGISGYLAARPRPHGTPDDTASTRPQPEDTP
jgi:hypothetical protein